MDCNGCKYLANNNYCLVYSIFVDKVKKCDYKEEWHNEQTTNKK